MLVTHDMNPILGVMDRLLYLAGGRAALGTPDEVVRAEVLGALYGHHVDVLRLHGRVLVVGGAAPLENGTVAAHPPIEVR